MSETKENVLRYLEQNKGHYSSGQAIATGLGLSRNSVWKAIETLRRDGYRIEAASRRGYYLQGETDKLSPAAIAGYLSEGISPDLIHVYDCLESTNKSAKSAASFDAPHGSVFIAEEQTSGIGRKKRQFSSPRGGIYMSIIIRPEHINLENNALITALTSVCVCSAIEALTNYTPKIRWISDILVENRKICGILTESAGDFDTGELEFVIAGIGISSISEAGGSSGADSGETTLSRNRLIAEIINRIMSYSSSASDGLCDRQIIDSYQKHMPYLGQTVKVQSKTESYTAKALGIDQSGKLVIELPGGDTKTLSTEEISIL